MKTGYYRHKIYRNSIASITHNSDGYLFIHETIYGLYGDERLISPIYLSEDYKEIIQNNWVYLGKIKYGVKKVVL